MKPQPPETLPGLDIGMRGPGRAECCEYFGAGLHG